MHVTNGVYLIRPVATEANIRRRTGGRHSHFRSSSSQNFGRARASLKHTHAYTCTTRTPHTCAQRARRGATPSHIHHLPTASSAPLPAIVDFDADGPRPTVSCVPFLPLFLSLLLASSTGCLDLWLAGDDWVMAMEARRAHATTHTTDMTEQDVNLGFRWRRRWRQRR
jgi:hypothetical protein